MFDVARLSSVILLCAGAIGCSDPAPSSGSTGTPVKNDAGSGSDTGSAVDAAPLTGCNQLTQLGAQLSAVGEAGTAPAATGGTFADGTYVMTKVGFYGLPGISNPAGALTASIAGTVMNTIATNDKGDVTRASYTIAVTGTKFTLTETCKVSSGAASGQKLDAGSYSVQTNGGVFLYVPLGGQGLSFPGRVELTKK
jgi:hypothetical protein